MVDSSGFSYLFIIAIGAEFHINSAPFFLPNTMVTVYQAVKIFCEQHNYEMPARKEILEVGSFISTHFKRFWGINQPAEIISQAGFLISEEPGKPILVPGYPDCFLPEMLSRISVFQDVKRDRLENIKKKEAIKAQKVTKSVTDTQRKRTPIKPKTVKVWSAKPANPTL